MINLVKQLKSDNPDLCVLYLTHFLREIPQISDRLIILDDSQILLNQKYILLEESFKKFDVINCPFGRFTKKDLKIEFSDLFSRFKKEVFYNLRDFNLVCDNLQSFRIIINKEKRSESDLVKKIVISEEKDLDISTFYFFLINNKNRESVETLDKMVSRASDRITIWTRLKLKIVKTLRNLFFSKEKKSPFDTSDSSNPASKLFACFSLAWHNSYFLLIRNNMFLSFKTPRFLSQSLFRLGMPLINYFTFTHTTNASKKCNS